LTVYEKIRGKTLKESQVFCFLDEVHFLDNWSLIVKKYFDKKYPIKFIISSSSASLFKKKLRIFSWQNN
jgi:predicted AAA+ superfamily ATPase